MPSEKDKDCACQGIGLIRDMLKTLDLSGSLDGCQRTMKLIPRIQAHIQEQAMKPGNEALFQKAMDSLDKVRDSISACKATWPIVNAVGVPGKYPEDIWMPTHHLDDIRDAIHKGPALKRLMVCDVVDPKKLDRVFDLAGGAIRNDDGKWGNTADALDELDDIANSLDC